MLSIGFRIRCLLWLSVLAVLAKPAMADVFEYNDRDGAQVIVEAKVVRTVEGQHLLALPTGEYRLIPKAAVIKRDEKPDPAPLTPNEMATSLEDKFGAARFRSYVEEPFVMGLVLSSELPKSADSRVRGFLRKTVAFMDKVGSSFKRYLKELRVPVKNPEYPLVVLIFESDDDFDQYMSEVTSSNKTIAKNVAGFYSGMTNFLAIRLHTCSTFEVPLHEAIHQQVYNRNFFQRLAPIPHWFDEGIATGFEANQGRINIGPTKISRRYAKQALAGGKLSWEKMLNNDQVFLGNVLVGEAYGHAWSLHWLLVSKHKVQYLKYLKILSQKQPLEKESPEQRAKDIEEAFGEDVASLQKNFKTILKAGIKRQRVKLGDQRVAGKSITQEGMGKVELKAVRRLDQAGLMEVQGRLTNLCPFRRLAFHVTVETDAGMYAEWHIPQLAINAKVNLKKQYVTKIMQGGSGASSRTFRVRVRAVPTDGNEAEKWKEGQLPVPVFGE